MDASELHEEFEGKITFHGGIDVQKLLPHGSPTEVREKVLSTLDAFQAHQGGYILCPSHNVQGDVPPENIMAMTQAVRDYAG